MRKRTWLVMVFSVLGASHLWALSYSPPKAPRPPRCRTNHKFFKYADTATVQTLNPLFTTTIAGHRVQSLLFDRLIYRGKGNLPHPGLATSWSVAKDKRSVTFLLRKGITWHDGKPFTAKDVKFTIEMRKKYPHRIDERGLQWLVSSVKIRTPFKLTVYLQEPVIAPILFFDFLVLPAHHKAALQTKPSKWRPKRRKLSLRGLPFLSKRKKRKKAKQRQGWRAVGTGPFRLVKWFNRKILLERRHHKWLGRACVRRIQLISIPDLTLAIEVLRYGGIDFMPWVLPRHAADLRRYKSMTMRVGTRGQWWSLVLNLRRKYMQDRRVRKALSLLLDRRAFLRLQGAKDGLIAHPVPPLQGKSIHVYKDQKKRIARADILLAKAGWKKRNAAGIRTNKFGDTLVVRLLISEKHRYLRHTFKQFRKELRKAGIVLKQHWVPQGKRSQKLWSRSDMRFEKHFSMRLTHLRAMFASQGRRNDSGYHNKQVDSLFKPLLFALPTAHPGKRRALAKALAHDLPHIFLWAPRHRLVYTRRARFPWQLSQPRLYFDMANRWEKR